MTDKAEKQRIIATLIAAVALWLVVMAMVAWIVYDLVRFFS